MSSEQPCPDDPGAGAESAAAEAASSEARDAIPETVAAGARDTRPRSKRRFIQPARRIALPALVAFITFGFGLLSSYAVRGLNAGGLARPNKPSAAADALPSSYTLPLRLADIGPQLIGAGAIDYEKFVEVYRQNGQPLTAEQIDLLTATSDRGVTIDSQNAYFLLNLFWALGLANQNPILTDGPIARQGRQEIGNFASTGGWTLGKKTAVELFASVPLIRLTSGQQATVEAVAGMVYRPCCGNPTLFPDCNHGMAMLGLLELMASQGASKEAMLQAAKYVNAFWFPQQTHELAVFFKANENLDYGQVEPARAVGAEFSSGDGAKRVHGWLDKNNLLEHEPNGGGSCGV